MVVVMMICIVVVVFSFNICNSCEQFECLFVWVCLTVCLCVWIFYYSNRNQSTLLGVTDSVSVVFCKMNGLGSTQLISKSPAVGFISDRNGFGKVASKLIFDWVLFLVWFELVSIFRRFFNSAVDWTSGTRANLR